MSLRKPRLNAHHSNGEHLQAFDIIEKAIANDFAGVNKALLEDPECINARAMPLGITALMAASAYGLEKMVEHLLSKPDVDISLKDEWGLTALEHGRAFPNVIQRIIEHEYPNLDWKEPEIGRAP